jgi:hypothetical protein
MLLFCSMIEPLRHEGTEFLDSLCLSSFIIPDRGPWLVLFPFDHLSRDLHQLMRKLLSQIHTCSIKKFSSLLDHFGNHFFIKL